MKTERKTNIPTQAVVPMVLLAALSVVIMARSWAVGQGAEVSPTQSFPPEDAAVIELQNAPPLLEVVAEKQEEPRAIGRYAGLSMTDGERKELAAVVYLEAANQSPEGQQAVAEVILNRVISASFPDSVSGVLHQGEGSEVPQFSTIGSLDAAEPTAAQYDAIDAALYGPSVLPEDVVFFSRGGENDRVWGTIGDHVFCYAYVWE